MGIFVGIPSSRLTSPTAKLLYKLNRIVCRMLFRVRKPELTPLPATGPAILVSDHTSLGDPLVLLATAGRPIVFLMAEEIYVRPSIAWVFRALHCVPVRRGTLDIKSVRAMVKALADGEVVGIFPEGGIDRYRDAAGYAGVGYLALKSGAPVVPASVRWDKPRPLTIYGTLLIPCPARVVYGRPLVFPRMDRPTSRRAREATDRIMEAIAALRGAGDGSSGIQAEAVPSMRS
ncbi:MAG: 1-acyl-sn-glycerol-3-phosphate acyltransferase [Nitrospirae bacterium]|nr:MAG: 1-acyl-sn-glycerol-3-phosphate acyltransferase [Nitrospirota bacterium]